MQQQKTKESNNQKRTFPSEETPQIAAYCTNKSANTGKICAITTFSAEKCTKINI